MGMRAVIYQHESHEDEGLLGPALTAAGFSLVKRFRAVAHRDDLAADLLVVMGGGMGVGDAATHPFLQEELGLLSERLAQEKPCLGICLGAQLMASAAGSEVATGKNGFEVGVAPVRWTTAGLGDPVVAGLAPKSAMAHWHHDTWSPVAGATLLASTDRYTQQAFRLGPSYAFQFHPELTAEDFGHWLDLGEEHLLAERQEVDELRRQLPRLRAAVPGNVEFLGRLAQHFARCVS
jgi:GMP synthase (glutamine-hydrolysing)